MSEPEAVGQDRVRFLVGVSWLAASAASLCFCINLVFVDDRAALWATNQLEPTQRRIFVITLLASALLPLVVASLAIARLSLGRVTAVVWRWGHRLSPIALLAPIAPLLDRASFIGTPITSLSYMLLIGVSAAAIGTRCLERGFATGVTPSVKRPRSLAPSALTVVVCFSLFAHFAFYSLLRHHQMQSDAYDLAIFDNMMWHLTHGEGFASTPAFGPEGNHLHRHTTFGAVLLVPFYAIWPRAETLLVLQAAFAASTPLPIYLLGRRLLGNPWLGFFFALCYALYAPTHGATFYDFHFLTMAAPLFSWVFFLSFTANTRALAVMTALTLAWREDTGAVLAFAGIVLWLAGIHRRRTLTFVVVSAVYFALVKFVLMPLGDSHSSYSGYFANLKAPGVGGFWSVIETALTNPLYVFSEVFDRRRLVYVLQLFVPLLFFPLRDRTTWLAFIPATVFTLMASRQPLFEIYFQYTAYWAPTVFLCLFLVLRRRFVQTSQSQALVASTAAILLTTLLTSFYFGSVFKSPTMRGGFRAISYEWTEKDEARLRAFRELTRQIPAEASTASTSRETPHLSNRRQAYHIVAGHFDADYIVVRHDEVRGRSEAAKRYRAVRKSGDYRRIDIDGGFSLWKRVEGTRADPKK